MEAAPRLPMISFQYKTSMEKISFDTKLKQYIASFYHEDPESYNNEILKLERLRRGATCATEDITSCQTLKEYYCQLHFLKSRFPLEEGQPCAIYFTWKDKYTNICVPYPDINFEMMCVLYNIGTVHTQLGAADKRLSSDEMKMSCTHFQCAAWAFQTLRETYPQMLALHETNELVHAMYLVCLAQAQECILEKSMLDNRKPLLIARIAAQVVDYYKQALTAMQAAKEDADSIKSEKYTLKYLSFKCEYHRCITLLYQGMQSEEQQKMGERVAFYQKALEHLDTARKYAGNMSASAAAPFKDGLTFTHDVVEGKRKAAKNENEFIYHEEVPDKDLLSDVKGASLVKGIPFSITDPEVSGPDIFAKLVPMEAHEASSLYSEKKAQMLRHIGNLVENKDKELAEFITSLQLDVLSEMHKTSGLPQDIIDRAAELSAHSTACEDLIKIMGKLSTIFNNVDKMLENIQELLKEEDDKEKQYQELMGKRPPSIVATDLSRESSKYQEAHSKAMESNEVLQKAITVHVANLRLLGLPLEELRKRIPSIQLPHPKVDEKALEKLKIILAKVDEMKGQRASLWIQLRDTMHKDDITGVLVTREEKQPLDQLFQKELEKHTQTATLIEKNVAAQENILKALTETYAEFSNSRRYLNDVIQKRNTMIKGILNSFDIYDDLVAKVQKGIEFYDKLETNVTKLLQRLKSTCKVQEEEREQILMKNKISITEAPSLNVSSEVKTPKLKDYLNNMKGEKNLKADSIPYQPSLYQPVITEAQIWPPSIRPAPVGSEINTDTISASFAKVENQMNFPSDHTAYGYYGISGQPYNSNMYTYTSMYNQPITNTGQSQYSGQSHFSDSYPVALDVTSTSIYNQHTPYGGIYSQAANVFPNDITSLPTDHTYSQNNTYCNYADYITSCKSSEEPIMELPKPQPDQSQVDYLRQMAYTQPIYAQPGPSSIPISTSAKFTDIPNNDKIEKMLSDRMAAMMPNQNQLTSSYVPTEYLQYSYGGQNYCPTYSYANTPTPNTSNYQTVSSTPYPYVTTSEQGPNAYLMNTLTDDAKHNMSAYACNTNGFDVNAIPDPTAQQNYQYPQYYQQQNVSNNQPNYYTYPQQTQQTSVVDQTGLVSNTGYNYYNQISQTSTDVAPQPTSSTLVSENADMKKESSIDLLSGLDFNISQAPLMPQLKSDLIPEKKIEIVVRQQQLDLTPAKILPVLEEKTCEMNEKPKLNIPKSDPFQNPHTLKQFSMEVEKFEKFCDSLITKTLNGPTTLDLKWKEIQDRQDNENYNRSISVARCYPLKNRFPDILPYDSTRVELENSKDDYINASYVKDASSNCPSFIVTQAPTHSTFADFWTMIWDRNAAIIVCLLNSNELGDEVYWPKEIGKDLMITDKVISLVSTTTKDHWVERRMSVSVPQTRKVKSLLHLQFTSWPGSLFPTSPTAIVNFVKETLTRYDEQTTLNSIVVHCSAGVGRSGLFCVLLTAILEVMINPNTIPDIPLICGNMSCRRKNIMRDREHLKFCYTAFLFYLKELQSRFVKTENITSSHSRKASTSSLNIPPIVDDPLSSLDPLWATKRK